MYTQKNLQNTRMFLVPPKIWKTWNYATKQKYFRDLYTRKKIRIKNKIKNFKKLVEKIKFILKRLKLKKRSTSSYRVIKGKFGKMRTFKTPLAKIKDLKMKNTLNKFVLFFKNNDTIRINSVYLPNTKIVCLPVVRNCTPETNGFRSYTIFPIHHGIYPVSNLFSKDTKWLDILFGGVLTRRKLAKHIKLQSYKELNYLDIPKWPSAMLWGSFELGLLANITNTSSKLAIIKSKCLHVNSKKTSVVRIKLRSFRVRDSNQYLFLYNRLWVINRLKCFLMTGSPCVKQNISFKYFLMGVLKNFGVKTQFLKLYKFCLALPAKKRWLQTTQRMSLLLAPINLRLTPKNGIKSLTLPQNVNFIWFNLCKSNPYKLFIGSFPNEDLLAINTLKYDSINIWIHRAPRLKILKLGVNNSTLLSRSKKQIKKIKTISVNSITSIQVFRPAFDNARYGNSGFSNGLSYSLFTPLLIPRLLNSNFLNALLLINNRNSSVKEGGGLILKKFISSLKISCFLTKYKFYKKSIDKQQKNYSRNIILRQFGWYEVDTLIRLKWYRKWFKRRFSRYRKIKKDIMFRNLLKSHFLRITGFHEKQLLNLWSRFRRGTNKYWGPVNLVTKFSQSLLLMPENIVLFLGFAPTQAAAKVLIQSGGLLINGLSSANLNYFIKPGDILQLNFRTRLFSKRLFSYTSWNSLRLRLSFISFFQVDWSTLMFTLVRWPHSYELIPPSFLSERWVRYYIRNFPVKIKQFRAGKAEWKLYVVPGYKLRKISI